MAFRENIRQFIKVITNGNTNEFKNHNDNNYDSFRCLEDFTL